MSNTTSGPVNDDNDSFGDKLNENNDEDNGNNVNLLDNLLVEENNAQMESDKQRQQLTTQKKVIMRGQGVKASMMNKKDSDSSKIIDSTQQPPIKMSRNAFN